MRTLTESFQVLNSFKGFGEPSSALWFVGIEEGGEWTKEDLQSRLVDAYEAPLFELDGRVNQKGEPHKTKVYPIASRVALGVLHGIRTCTDEEARDFQHRKLGRRKSGTFLSNLYPLGKKSRDTWPAQYVELGFDSAKACRTAVVDERIELLRHLRNKHKPDLIVCHGQKDWDQFEECFADPHAEWHAASLPHNGKPLRWQKGLVLSQFFATQGGLMEYSGNVPALIDACRKASL